MAAVSLVIITLNEEKNIARCIQSAPFVDEVIVLDSGSTDRTVEIARGLGARVEHQAWLGYAQQKTRAMELAKNPWILSLDADEALSPELLKEITLLLGDSSRLTADAYAMPRMTWYLGRWMRHSGMYPDYQTRLFDRRRAHWKPTHVHEHIVAEKVAKLQAPILHWSFDSIAQHVETINRYSALRARDFAAKGKRFSSAKILTKTFSKFLQTYIWKRGFLDGVPGLIACMVSAFATTLRWAKLYENEIAPK